MSQDEKSLEKGNVEGKNKFHEPPTLRKVCSISCSMPARDFIKLLKREGVKAVLDVRVNRNYRAAGFQGAEDDFRFLCELTGIDYHVVHSLTPTAEMRKQFGDTFKFVKRAEDRDPEAWTNFLVDYENLLKERKPFRHSPLIDIIYGDYESIAVACACRHHDDCHRSMACGLIENLFPEVKLKVLYPNNKVPSRASPRRYRLKDFYWSKLRAEKRRGEK